MANQDILIYITFRNETGNESLYAPLVSHSKDPVPVYLPKSDITNTSCEQRIRFDVLYICHRGKMADENGHWNVCPMQCPE